jgi:predicted nucleic acid-binding protein
MRSQILLDTGPLVAFLNRRDRHHAWATAELSRVAPPLLTCEAVISEACFVLRTLQNASDAVLNLIEQDLIQTPFHLQEAITPVKRLMARYADVPMSLADACLVHLAEQYPTSAVMTCDSDFIVYRKHRRQVIPTIMPDHG